MTPVQVDGMKEACLRDLDHGLIMDIIQTLVQQDTLMVTIKNAERKKRLSIKRKQKSKNIAEDTNRLRREELLYHLTSNPQNLPLGK